MSTLAQFKLLRVVLALGASSSILVAWRFYLPDRAYPAVSLISTTATSFFDPVGMLFCFIGLLGGIASPRILLLYVIGFIFLAIGDQSRIQPYNVFFFWAAWILFHQRVNDDGPCRGCELSALLRWLIVGAYFWAGVAKLNSGFPHSGFNIIIGQYSDLLPAQLQIGGGAGFLLLAYGSAVLEIAIAIGLCLPVIRKAALVSAVALHVFILYSLGPLQMNSATVVWPWNFTMGVFDIILFAGFTGPMQSPRTFSKLRAPAFLIFLFVGLAPALNRFDLWDDYLSFHAYSGGTVDARLVFGKEDFELLPQEIRDVLGPQLELGFYEWASKAYRASAYPNHRVYRSITRTLCVRHNLSNKSGVILLDRPMDGRRAARFLPCNQLLAN